VHGDGVSEDDPLAGPKAVEWEPFVKATTPVVWKSRMLTMPSFTCSKVKMPGFVAISLVMSPSIDRRTAA